MLAVGNDELGGPVPDMVKCAKCGGMHRVQYGDEILPDGTRKPCKMLAFIKCGDNAYLVGVAGRTIK